GYVVRNIVTSKSCASSCCLCLLDGGVCSSLFGENARFVFESDDLFLTSDCTLVLFEHGLFRLVLNNIFRRDEVNDLLSRVCDYANCYNRCSSCDPIGDTSGADNSNRCVRFNPDHGVVLSCIHQSKVVTTG